MNFRDGIIVDCEKTFGTLNFRGLDKITFVKDEQGQDTDELKSIRYSLKSKGQEQIIQVSLLADKEEKTFNVNDEVELVNPIVKLIPVPTFGTNAKIEYYVQADDIVKKSEVSNKVNIGKEEVKK